MCASEFSIAAIRLLFCGALVRVWLVPALCAALVAFGAWATPAAAQACDPRTDAHCYPHSHHRALRPAPMVPLLPVREYLKAAGLPPSSTGGYGIVAFTSNVTSATRAKHLMVCRSFVAHFPSNASLASTPPLSDRMITVWPLDDPKAAEAAADDCGYIVDHTDAAAGASAIAEAAGQRVNLKGEGPFLIGFSPSNTLGGRDVLVLVVDLSAAATQERIDREFAFWKDEIVADPSPWARHP